MIRVVRMYIGGKCDECGRVLAPGARSVTLAHFKVDLCGPCFTKLEKEMES